MSKLTILAKIVNFGKMTIFRILTILAIFGKNRQFSQNDDFDDFGDFWQKIVKNHQKIVKNGENR
jgi:hypothetical protein